MLELGEFVFVQLDYEQCVTQALLQACVLRDCDGIHAILSHTDLPSIAGLQQRDLDQPLDYSWGNLPLIFRF